VSRRDDVRRWQVGLHLPVRQHPQRRGFAFVPNTTWKPARSDAATTSILAGVADACGHSQTDFAGWQVCWPVFPTREAGVEDQRRQSWLTISNRKTVTTLTMAFSADGPDPLRGRRRAHDPRFRPGLRQGAAFLWASPTSKESRVLAVSPDGKRLASVGGGDDSSVRLER